MEVIVERCTALDVHKDTVLACVRRPGAGRRRDQEVRELPHVDLVVAGPTRVAV